MNKAICSILTATFLFLSVSLTLLPARAGAQVIYQQTTLETTDLGGYQDFCQQLADDFVPGVTGSVGDITWTGIYYGANNPAATESFTVQIFADNAGLPADLPLYQIVGSATKSDSGSTLLGEILYNYSLSIASPTLSAGTTYWVSIYTNEPCNNYAWSNSTDGSTDGALRNLDGAWSQLDASLRSNHIFTLNMAAAAPSVSEPVPTLHPVLLVILALALAGLGIIRRSKFKPS
ncbi:MAG: choice-of-anchor R domain-containing protein [Porticoccaceae bacterium]